MSTQHTRYAQASPPVAALVDFRTGFFRCLTGWADAAFELCDASLCAPAPVTSVPTLSLEPAFRRSHGSLYKALSLGRVDHEGMRDLLVAHRPTTWPAVSGSGGRTQWSILGECAILESDSWTSCMIQGEFLLRYCAV